MKAEDNFAIRKKLRSVLENVMKIPGTSSVAIIRRDGALIEAIEKKEGTIKNFKKLI